MPWLLLLSVIISSCKSGAEKYEEQLIRNAVSRYNTLLQEVYAGGNISLLDDVAGEGERRRIDVNIITMKNEGKYLKARLKELRFKSVRIISPEEAEVITSEKWEYAHMNLFTNVQISDTKLEEMNMVYSLIKENNRWIVDYVDVEGNRLGKKVDRFREYRKWAEEYEKQKKRENQVENR